VSLTDAHDDLERTAAALSEGYCPSCLARLETASWPWQDVPELLPDERAVGQCRGPDCGVTWSVVAGDFTDWLWAGCTSDDFPPNRASS
jgi:hypothetical protein